MNKSVEKAANFYTAYLTSDDSSVLLSPAIQSAIDGQLQGFKEQIGYKRYIVTEIIPNDRRPTRKQDQLITKPTKDFMDVKELLEYEDYVQKPTKAHASSIITLTLEEHWKQVQQTDGYLKYIAMRPRAERLGYNKAQAWRALLRAHHNDIAAAMHFSLQDFRWYTVFHNEGHHPHDGLVGETGISALEPEWHPVNQVSTHQRYLPAGTAPRL